jgi:hypothetical protein
VIPEENHEESSRETGVKIEHWKYDAAPCLFYGQARGGVCFY